MAVASQGGTALMTPSSPWRGESPLILASASATRAQLLRNAGLSPQPLPAAIDERALQAQLPGDASPAHVAMALAAAKARHVAAFNPGRWVLGADQTLDCDGEMFHKPAGRRQAAAQLARLAGRTHRLTSAAALIRDGRIEAEAVSEARLTMRPLSAEALNDYLDLAGEAATASVGAYRVEGLGIHLFEAIDGDHFTILGLPLISLLAEMRRLELLTP
jgi:septum formation protein